MSCTFNPSVLSKWNLLESPPLTSVVKATFPFANVPTERVAVLSRSGVELQSLPLTILKDTSMIGLLPEVLFCGTAVKEQTVSPGWIAKGILKASKLEIPGILPPIAGSLSQLGQTVRR